MPKGIYIRSKFSLHANNQGDPVQILWSRVDKNGPIHPVLKTRCWLWVGYKVAGGYGQIKGKKSHRPAYQYTNGSIPDGMFVCHKCDNPPCCNPDHLFLGTAQDNMTDKVVKNRQARGGPGDRAAKGERNGRAILTSKQVMASRRLYSEGRSVKAIIKYLKLRVDHYVLRSVIKGRSWAHLPLIQS